MGLGEGVPVVAPVITPATRAAIELRKLGVQTTGMNPELIAAMDEGVTVDALVELAGMHPGKAIAYLCRAARRERAEVAAPVVVGQPRAGPAPAIGKQAQGIKALEDLKNAARNRMAGGGNHGGDAETVHALAGPDASG